MTAAGCLYYNILYDNTLYYNVLYYNISSSPGPHLQPPKRTFSATAASESFESAAAQVVVVRPSAIFFSNL